MDLLRLANDRMLRAYAIEKLAGQAEDMKQRVRLEITYLQRALPSAKQITPLTTVTPDLMNAVELVYQNDEDFPVFTGDGRDFVSQPVADAIAVKARTGEDLVNVLKEDLSQFGANLLNDYVKSPVFMGYISTVLPAKKQVTPTNIYVALNKAVTADRIAAVFKGYSKWTGIQEGVEVPSGQELGAEFATHAPGVAPGKEDLPKGGPLTRVPGEPVARYASLMDFESKYGYILRFQYGSKIASDIVMRMNVVEAYLDSLKG